MRLKGVIITTFVEDCMRIIIEWLEYLFLLWIFPFLLLKLKDWNFENAGKVFRKYASSWKIGTIVIMLWNRVQLSRLPITKYVNTASLSTVRFENAKPFKSIPGPISFPGMGSGYYMFKKDYRDHHEQLYIKLYKKYGPLIRLNLFGVNTLVIADPHDAAEMFLHEGDYPDMPSLTMIVGFQRWYDFFTYSNYVKGIVIVWLNDLMI